MNSLRSLETDLHLSLSIREALKAMTILGREMHNVEAAEKMAAHLGKAFEALEKSIDLMELSIKEARDEQG